MNAIEKLDLKTVLPDTYAIVNIEVRKYPVYGYAAYGYMTSFEIDYYDNVCEDYETYFKVLKHNSEANIDKFRDQFSKLLNHSVANDCKEYMSKPNVLGTLNDMLYGTGFVNFKCIALIPKN